MWLLTQMSMTSRRLLQGDAAALAGIEAVHGKSAEIAFGVADIGDGKLQIARPAVLQNLRRQAAGRFF